MAGITKGPGRVFCSWSMDGPLRKQFELFVGLQKPLGLICHLQDRLCSVLRLPSGSQAVPCPLPPAFSCSRSVQSISLEFLAYYPAPCGTRGPLGAEMGLSCSLLYWGAVFLVVSPWPFVPLLSAWAILPTSRHQYHLLKRFSHFPGHQNHLELVLTQLWRPIPINSHSLGLGAPRFLPYPLTTLTPPSLPNPPHTFEAKKC